MLGLVRDARDVTRHCRNKRKAGKRYHLKCWGPILLSSAVGLELHRDAGRLAAAGQDGGSWRGDTGEHLPGRSLQLPLAGTGVSPW